MHIITANIHYTVTVTVRDSEPDISAGSDESEHPIPIPDIELSNLLEENFQAHTHFVLAHKPWELLNALKTFKVIINVPKKTNH